MSVILKNLPPGRAAWLTVVALCSALFGACGGVASSAPIIDADLNAFSDGINRVLRTGMSIKEARSALREKFPRPSLSSEVTPSIPNANRSMQTRRYMIGWPTTTAGTTMVVTIFCDRDGNVVRWTTGPVHESS